MRSTCEGACTISVRSVSVRIVHSRWHSTWCLDVRPHWWFTSAFWRIHLAFSVDCSSRTSPHWTRDRDNLNGTWRFNWKCAINFSASSICSRIACKNITNRRFWRLRQEEMEDKRRKIPRFTHGYALGNDLLTFAKILTFERNGGHQYWLR